MSLIPEFEFIENEVLEGCRVKPNKLHNTLVRTEAQFAEMMKELLDQPRLAYDTETSGLSPHLGARIIGHAFGRKTKSKIKSWYVPVRHAFDKGVLHPDAVAESLHALFIPERVIEGHHLKFDAKLARADGIEIASAWNDTALEAIIHNENEDSFALKALTARYIYPAAKQQLDRVSQWARMDARQLKMPFKKRRRAEPTERTYMERFGYIRVPIELLGVYACHDTAFTLLLHAFLAPRIESFPKVYERELKVARILLDLEWYGMPIDAAEIQRTGGELQEEMKHWQSVVTSLVGELPDFSDETLRVLFFEHLKLDPPKRTQKGFSVDKETRHLLSKSYPDQDELMTAINGYKTAHKLHSTYAESWPRYISPEQRIHSNYVQIEQRDDGGVPVTGRLSSSDPNTQNVVSKSVHLFKCGCEACVKKGKMPAPTAKVSIRRYYTVPRGWVRAWFDLSQIELRVIALLSRDPVLLNCYANDLDVHQITADEVTGGDRFIAKQVNFGNSYGMTKIGLARRLPHYAERPEEAIEEAEEYLKRFFEKYAGIMKFRRKFANKMRENNGTFTNAFGRPRRIIEVLDTDRKLRSRGERMMMSSIVSGTAADMLKEILIRSEQMLVEHYGSPTDRGRAVQTIHDEIAYDLPIMGCAPVLAKIKHCFTDWPAIEKRGVPIRVSCALSTTTWEEKRSITIQDDGAFTWD